MKLDGTRTKLSELKTPNNKSEIENSWRKKSLKTSLKLFVSMILILPKFSLQSCVVTETKGQGVIRGWKLAQNKSLLIVDHWIVHRVLSLETKKIIYEIDLKPFFHQVGQRETSVKGAFFVSETEIEFITDSKYYRFNTETSKMLIITPDPNFGRELSGKSLLDIRTEKQNFLAAKTSKDIRVFITEPKFILLKSWNPFTKTSPSYSKIGKISYIQNLKKTLTRVEGRVYFVIKPRNLGYFSVSSEKNFWQEKQLEEKSWTNITSNIAISKSKNLISYGLNRTKFISGIKFRDLELNEKFESEIETPFIQCKFDLENKFLVIYSPEGRLCLLNYDLELGKVSTKQCYLVVFPEFEIEFFNEKMILFKESVIAVYQYPEVELSFVYSPQPKAADEKEDLQLHVFPGFKVRIFLKEEMRYKDGDFWTGNVQEAGFNPLNKNEVFVLSDMKFIKKIRVEDSEVIGSFTPLEMMDLSEKLQYKTCELLSFDSWKKKEGFLVILCRCFKFTDNSRHYYLLQLNHFDNSVEFGEFLTDDYLNQLKIGEYQESEIVNIGGAQGRYFIKISSQFKLLQIKFEQNPGFFRYQTGLELLDSGKIALDTGANFFNKFQIFFSQNKFDDSKINIFNCLPEVKPVLDDSDKTPAYYCGGNSFVRLATEENSPSSYLVSLTNEITGALFKTNDNKLYIQQNEKTRVRYTGDSSTCSKNSIEKESTAWKPNCRDTNCQECDLETSSFCYLCNPLHYSNKGVCLPSCPSGTYLHKESLCLENCPLGFYKLDSDVALCVSDCTEHFPHIYKLGDRCSACESSTGGGIRNGSLCSCPKGKVLMETGICEDFSDSSCPRGFYWFHYDMCVESTRKNFFSHIKENGQKFMYCDSENFLDFENNFKCVGLNECQPPGKYIGSHPEYENICLSASQCAQNLTYKLDSFHYKCIENCPEEKNFTIVPSMECVKSCPENMFFFKPNSSCISHNLCQNFTSPKQHFTKQSDQGLACVTNCGEKFLKYNKNFTCITFEECKKIPEGFIKEDTNSCVSESECFGNDMYPLKESKECVLSCFEGGVYNHEAKKCEEKFDLNSSIPLKILIWSLWFQLILLQIIPVISPLITNSGSSKLLSYIAQTFKKIFLYSYFGFKLIQKSDELYMTVIGGVDHKLSRNIVQLLFSQILLLDKDYVCKEKSWRLCHIDARVDFFTNQSFSFLVIAVIGLYFFISILLKKCSKFFKKNSQRIKLFSIPNFWFGNQLGLIFSAVLNFSSPIFSHWFFVFSFWFSFIFLISTCSLFIVIRFFKLGKESVEFGVLVESGFKNIFKDIKFGKYFTQINFQHDIILALIIVFLQKFPVIQALLWFILQVLFSFFVYKKVEFKSELFHYRTIGTEIGLCLLSIVILMGCIFGETHFLSWMIFFMTVLVILLNKFCVLFFGIQEILNWCKKNEKKKNQIAPETVRDSERVLNRPNPQRKGLFRDNPSNLKKGKIFNFYFVERLDNEGLNMKKMKLEKIEKKSTKGFVRKKKKKSLREFLRRNISNCIIEIEEKKPDDDEEERSESELSSKLSYLEEIEEEKEEDELEYSQEISD